MEKEVIPFTHLHTHTPEGSLLDGFMRIEKAVSQAKEWGMDALGVSDHGTMAAHQKFYTHCKKEGIHPVLGMEAYITYDKAFKKEDFEAVEFILDEKESKIFRFIEKDKFDEDWFPIANFSKKVTRTSLEMEASDTYGVMLYNETKMEGEQDLKPTVLKKRVKALMKSYADKDFILCVKANTKRKEFFEWFPKMGHLLLIAKNNEGYQNLLQLNAIGQLDGFYGKPRIDYEDIQRYGKGIVATTACFLKGAPVLTENGVESIEKIEPGTNLWTHEGNMKAVEFRTTREYEGDIYTFTTKGSTFNPTSTADHKFLTFKQTIGSALEGQMEKRTLMRSIYENEMPKPSAKNKAKEAVPYGTAKWVEAKDINKGDYLLSAIDDKVERKDYVNLSSFAKDFAKSPIKNYILFVSEELLTLLGVYAAEGSFGRTGVTFTIDSEKKELIDFVLKQMDLIFGQTGKVYKKKGQQAVDIDFLSMEVRELFWSWFGHGAEQKRMPDFIRHLEPKKQIHFLRGFFYGDGHSRIEAGNVTNRATKGRNEVSCSTISKTLVTDIVHILHRNSINPSVSTYAKKVDKNGVNHREWYSVNIYGVMAKRIHDFVWERKPFHNNLAERMIRDIPLEIEGVKYMRQEVTRISSSYYSGDVFCLNVKDDHSFHAFGTAVHNCLGSVPSQLIRKGKLEEAKQEIARYVEAFDEVFLEVQPSRQPEQWVVNNQLFEWSKELGLPLIATTDAHMVSHDELELHKTLTNIGSGSSSFSEDSSDISVYESAYLMHPKDILDRGIPREALQNAYDLSHRCQVDFLEQTDTKFPEYAVPKGHDFDSYLEDLVWQGLFDLFLRKDYVKDYKLYQERVRYELDIIKQKRLSAYFVIVWDYINWARQQGIYVGPGRGSAAGSLVAYALSITNMDPLKYDLLFERFLNPDRPGNPDIDTDFSFYRRHEVIDYLTQKYGKDHVAQIGTYSQMSSKSILKNVGKVMGVDHNLINDWNKEIPSNMGNVMALEQAVEDVPTIKRAYEQHPQLFDLAMDLEKMPKSAGVHACGILVFPQNLQKSVPIMRGKAGQSVTQYEGPILEDLGAVKFDLLGLKNLSIFEMAVKLIEKRHGVHIDMNELEPDDENVFEMIRQGNTQGIFQMELRLAPLAK